MITSHYLCLCCFDVCSIDLLSVWEFLYDSQAETYNTHTHTVYMCHESEIALLCVSVFQRCCYLLDDESRCGSRGRGRWGRQLSILTHWCVSHRLCMCVRQHSTGSWPILTAPRPLCVRVSRLSDDRVSYSRWRFFFFQCTTHFLLRFFFHAFYIFKMW